MNKRLQHIIYFVLLIITMTSCSVSRQFPINYYNEHEKDIVGIEAVYSHIAQPKLLSLGFTDEQFRHVLIEMKTDSIRYVYEFSLNDPSLYDSLYKYGYDTTATAYLLQYMKKAHCTWVNKLDYYVGGEKRLLTFMSIRNKSLRAPFAPEKYFILTFYSQPQYYDEKGILLDRRNLRRARKVNNEIFYRINEKVCYTLSAKFR
jgi:hypothetical protein